MQEKVAAIGRTPLTEISYREWLIGQALVGVLAARATLSYAEAASCVPRVVDRILLDEAARHG